MQLSSFLLTATATSIGRAISQKQVTSREVVEWYLARIAKLNFGTDGINAVRTVSTRALDAAIEADGEIAAGRSRGPLHGVPYLLKDNIFTADGMTAAGGARALANFVPPYEATLVRRLGAAGAVLLGKTNLTEFADFVSDVMPSEFSGAGGVVRNPLGTRYDRGQGSSVGSAAAVAARLCAFAIGSETQNSIQSPAVFTSIVGFKPTVGRVSRHGIIPLVPSQDSPGPLTVSVNDAALVYDAIAGADVADSITLAWLESPERLPPREDLQGVRIGVPRKFVADLALTPERIPAFERVLASLRSAGANVVDPCDLPTAQQLHEVRSSVFRTEFKASLDALLSTLRPCGIDSMSELIAWNAAHAEAIPYGQSLLEAANATTGTRVPSYVEDRIRDIDLSATHGIVAALRGASADVLLSPMTIAAKCTGKAGVPVVAIPCGKDDSGLPFGITLYAAPGADRRLLSIAAAIERAAGERIEPSLPA